MNLLLGLLLGEQHLVDVGEDTTRGDGDAAEQLVQLLVVADGQLQVAGDDAATLVVTGGIASELQDLGAQVLEHSREVHGCAATEAGSHVLLAHEAGHTTDRELEAGARRARHGLAGCTAATLALALALAATGQAVLRAKATRGVLTAGCEGGLTSDVGHLEGV